MKFSKLGLLGVLGISSLSNISSAQFFIPENIRAQAYAKENAKNKEQSKEPEKLNEQPLTDSIELEPLNPYGTYNPAQIIHLEYFRYVPEKTEEENELKYLEFLRKEKHDRKVMQYSEPLQKIESWMKVGLSLYSKDWNGYPYEISIKKEEMEIKSYYGIIANNGRIGGLDDLGVFSLTDGKKTDETYTVEIEAKIRGKNYPGDVIATEKREIIVD